MARLGRHLLGELMECEELEALNDVDLIKEEMENAARLAGATIVTSSFHHFSPHGVSGVVVISESHLAIHTWPEYGYAAVDVFTCGETVSPYIAFEYLKSRLASRKVLLKEHSRGTNLASTFHVSPEKEEAVTQFT